MQKRLRVVNKATLFNIHTCKGARHLGEYDSGEIVAQTEVTVIPNDIYEQLAARVLKREQSFLVEVICNIVNEIVKLGI